MTGQPELATPLPPAGVPLCPAGTDDPTNTRRLTQKYLTAFAFMVFGQQDWARDVLVGDAMLSDVGANLVTYELSGGF